MLPLSLLSAALYPEYLAHIESLSHLRIPLRTHHALQHIAPGDLSPPATSSDLAEFAPGLHVDPSNFTLLEESSLDPRDLCAALPPAFLAAGGTLLEDITALAVESDAAGVSVRTSQGFISAATFIDCCGAWSAQAGFGSIPVHPVKGQMLNICCPPERLRAVVRAPQVYLVPRGDGRVVAGATLEHVGFDQSVVGSAIEGLARAARQFLPEAVLPATPDAWSGLRPGTPDGLPILGRAQQPHCWHATGHYRDGILLAPATARVMAQAIAGEVTAVALEQFSSSRF
jgi:glycine oxidase